MTCERHGEYEAFFLKHADRWSVCPDCQREEREERERLEANVRRQREIREAIGRSGIPERFKERNFENYIIGQNSAQNRAYGVLRDFAYHFPRIRQNGVCALLLGKCGTGKTHLATSIANYIMPRGYSALYMTVYDAVSKFKETFNSDLTEENVLAMFATPDLLILDEAGVGFGSEAEKLFIYRLINRRYEQVKPSIMIANLTIDEFKDRVGERVLDRLLESEGAIIPFTWNSHRTRR